jgi:hypothetical protein
MAATGGRQCRRAHRGHIEFVLSGGGWHLGSEKLARIECVEP